jgi:hypothetical protein
MAVLAAVSLAEALLRSWAVLLAGAALALGAYAAGRRHGARRGPGQRAADRSLEAAQRDRLAAELESLAGRSLDEICQSYRLIARQHGGRP